MVREKKKVIAKGRHTFWNNSGKQEELQNLSVHGSLSYCPWWQGGI